MKSDTIINKFHNDCHSHLDVKEVLGSSKGTNKVVLAGNPNVGKSLFFNYLSGMYVDVSNFPGTTISITKGTYKDYEIFDTPGVYGVSSFNDEEKVARDIILSGDIVLNVVNALHLERDLFLTMQLIEMGKKVTVFLNFSDEVKKRKLKIDVKRLSELLGVEVIETSAVTKAGFDKVEYAIENAREGNQSPELHHLLHNTLDRVGTQAEALIILEGDEFIAEKHGIPPGTADQREAIYINRRNTVNEIVSEVEFEDSKKGEFFNKLGRMSVNPVTGLPILAVVLVIVYFFIGDFISQRVVKYTENTLGKGEFEYHVKSFVGKYTPVDITVDIQDDNGNPISTKDFSFPHGLNSDVQKAAEFKKISAPHGTSTSFEFQNPFVKLFFGEFGIITMTITYLLFLLLPLVAAFYFVMALLEDSGYLPRLATMLDRSLNKLGLNGRAVIPLILGFGCVTMATITTRLLGTEREKTIVTAILQFVIPCSAQLAVIAVLMSMAGAVPFTIYVITILTVLIVLSTLLNRFLPGESSPLLIDLPAMRLPRLDNIFKKMFYRTYGFMKEASFWFFVGALAVGIMELTGLLTVWQDILEPFTTMWLKLPKEAANAFVMGMVRRDFGAAGLFHLTLSPMQITVAITTITLFVPCIASFVIMLKERGWKQGLIIWSGTWFFAFLVGGIIAQIFV
ncbi:MAG: FeoB small GTPase domain-containing protein [Bacteroidota bacterium]|jgi:ferrous iron transport protein B|nr:ferrous iron transporter B [Ignavibacteria bacterium]MCU7497761.1 ferrous iron transporter B [Ignavibacteria bacterium]MCU7510934.1 ferrous iron transporter B [Ignavibacteria bacterium]MCU7518788.1 ferrous iron transporter B [Ignavibacteria bacterium]MCU7523242.1 ferrous iron transporter B [Ignavibacteria bacterium]